MQEILRLTLKVALVSALVAGSALAAPQSQDPPGQDPAKTPPPAQQQTQQQTGSQPVQQKDTVTPKNSKEDVEAIGNRSVGKGSLTYADGNLYLLGEDKIIGLAEASPTGYREKGRFRIADQGWPSWAHPVVSGGRLYIRNQGTLSSYDIRAR